MKRLRNNRAWIVALMSGLVCAAELWAAPQYSTNLPPELANPSVAAVECRARKGLPNFFSKLQRGDEVRIAYFGGSITAQDGWRPKSLKWFQDKFPQAKTSQINAAIGGTGSDLGVFRCQQDVLQHKPDLLFVEFAVNDGGAAPEQIYRCMEGIIRQTWRANRLTDVCFVYTLAGNMLATLQAGKFPRAASAMEKLADHYGIPTIHLGYEVAQLEKSGRLVFKGAKPKTEEEKARLGDKVLFSPDEVHPYTDTGHQLYLDAITRSLPQIQAAGMPGPHPLIEPFVADNWEQAKLLPLSRATLSGGWQKLDPATNNIARSFKNRLPELWMAGKPGESVTFKFKGVAAGIYDLLGPDCGQLIVTLDDRKPINVARFDSFCTYHRLGKFMAAEKLPATVHTVRIEIHPQSPDKAKILAQRQEKMDKPERFEGTQWYAGYLLLIGDLVE
jgi:lysophospholipase L1-like esterase